MDECFCKDLDRTMAVEEIEYVFCKLGFAGCGTKLANNFDDKDRRFGVYLTQAEDLNVVNACIWLI